MSQRQYLSCISLLLVLTLQSTGASFAATPEPVPSAAQQKPLVHLSLAQSASFSEALDALAAQGHVAIVAEGAPLVSRLSKKDTQDWVRSVLATARLRAGLPTQKQRSAIPLERQVRIAAGALGICPMMSALRRLPWNRA